jgi:hypothetical protein
MALLQNIWFQISIGLLPALAVVLVILFRKKIFRMAYLTLSVGVAAAFAFSCVFAVTQVSALYDEVDDEELSPLSANQLVELANSFLLCEDSDGALEMVDLYAEQYGYDDTCTLINARACVLDQRFEAALASYKKYYGANLPEEAKAVETIVLGLRSDLAISERLAEVGYSTGSSVTEDVMEALVCGGAKEQVFRAIRKEAPDDQVLEGIKWIMEVDRAFDTYVINGYIDSDTLDSLLEDVEELQKDHVFKRLVNFRNARVKVMLLDGNFEDIITYLSPNAGCAEYMTVFELYLAGHVDKDALSKSMDIPKVRGVGKLIDRLEDLLKVGEESLPYSDIRRLEDQIAMLKAYDEDSVLYAFEKRLRSEADDPDNYEFASKIYMGLSKLCYMRGDEARRNQYFSDALVTAPASDDGDYAAAMDGFMRPLKT